MNIKILIFILFMPIDIFCMFRISVTPPPENFNGIPVKPLHQMP